MPDLLTFRSYPVAGYLTAKNNDPPVRHQKFLMRLKQPSDPDDPRLFIYAGFSENYTALHHTHLLTLLHPPPPQSTPITHRLQGKMLTTTPSGLLDSEFKHLKFSIRSVPGNTVDGLELTLGEQNEGYQAILTPRQRIDFQDTIRNYQQATPRTLPDEITVVTEDGTTTPSLNIPEQ